MHVDHIAIAVHSLDEQLEAFRSVWGLEATSIETHDSDAVREAMLPIGDTCLQLLEATNNESTVARFVERRGEGLHHIAIAVDDLNAELDRLRAAGARLVDEQPRPGGGDSLAAFVHPQSSAGVLVELVQHGALS
jgi:methylmalonyl-CoA/ethylmalonyl-CoA epimerase